MNKNILYVDDEPWFAEALVDALRDSGYTVELALNGSEAIEILRHREFHPDLIVLDVIMPTGDDIIETSGGRRTGLKVHEIIRKQLGLRMPILFLTVVDDPDAEQEIANVERNVGNKNYGLLVKPVLPTELLEKVSSMINISLSQRRQG